MSLMNPLRRFAVVFACLALAACASAQGPALSASEGAAHRQGGQIVILVGADGLRPQSLIDWPDAAPTINALAGRGVRAAGLTPAMPTKTFVNFYSIATGLHPDRHGITSNLPMSREKGRAMARDGHSDGSWWGGEPIWATAEKQGVTTAAMFWLGSEAEVAGVRPTHWSPYEHDKPYAERTAQVLGWLALPEAARPRFITLYFDAVDSAGHEFGPGTAEERAALARVDAELARLVAGIEELGLEDRVNVIVVSDHGMSAVGEDQVIYLDDYTSLDGVFVPIFHDGETAGYGVAIHLFTHRVEEVYAGLAGAHPAMTVYRREHLPPRWRMNHPDRTGDIVAVAAPGWLLFGRTLATRYPGLPGGMHGYDRHHPEMLAAFVAAGPRFAEGVVAEPFDNVEIYGLIAEILGLEPADTDGDLDRVRHLLRR